MPPLADAALSVADALGLHGGPADPSFAAHAAQLRVLAQPGALSDLAATSLPGALVSLWTTAGLPGTLSADGQDGVRWAGTIAGATAGVRVGSAAGLGISVSIDGLTACRYSSATWARASAAGLRPRRPTSRSPSRRTPRHCSGCASRPSSASGPPAAP